MKAEKRKDNGCTLSFYIGYLFGDTVVFETKNWRNDNEDFWVFQKSSQRIDGSILRVPQQNNQNVNSIVLQQIDYVMVSVCF